MVGSWLRGGPLWLVGVKCRGGFGTVVVIVQQGSKVGIGHFGLCYIPANIVSMALSW